MSTEYSNGPNQFGWADVCQANPGNGYTGCVTGIAIDANTRHSGGSNLAFADGHVKWASASTIVGNWPRWGQM
ncbi:MAG: hypothetical protein GW893_05440 [Armatimonadetes bacterium]|nr:hypothetical protein [Armatimonadota bacterium]